MTRIESMITPMTIPSTTVLAKHIPVEPMWFESPAWIELGVVARNAFSGDKSRYGWKEAAFIVVIIASIIFTAIGYMDLHEARSGNASKDYVFGKTNANGWDYLAMIAASLVTVVGFILFVVVVGPYAGYAIAALLR